MRCRYAHTPKLLERVLMFHALLLLAVYCLGISFIGSYLCQWNEVNIGGDYDIGRSVHVCVRRFVCVSVNVFEAPYLHNGAR